MGNLTYGVTNGAKTYQIGIIKIDKVRLKTKGLNHHTEISLCTGVEKWSL